MKRIFTFLFLLGVLVLSTLNSTAATRTWSGGTGVALNWTTGANWGGIAPVAGDDIIFNTAGLLNFTTMPANVAYNSITISQGTITLNAVGAMTITVGGAAGVDFTIANNASLTLGTNVNLTMAVNATGTITGTLTVNAARTFNSTNAGVVTTVNGSIIANGTVNCGTATRLVFSSGSTYQHNVNNVALPTATWVAGSLLNVTGVVGTALANLNQNFSDITWNCPAQTVVDMRFNEMTAIRNLTITSTNTGSLRIASNASGNIGITVSGFYSQTGGTLNCSNDAAGAIGTLNVAGNFSHTGGTITETAGGSGLIVFNGTGAQTLTGGGTVSNLINYRLNNTSATGVTLTTPYTINNTLTFTDGYLFTSTTNLLTIAAGATTPSASNASFVQGPVKKVGNTAYVFPVGNSAIYAPLSISAPGVATDAFTAEYFRGVPPDQASRISQISGLSSVDYWRLDRPTGASLVNVTLSWSPTSYDPGLPPYGGSSTIAFHSTATSKWASHSRNGGNTGTPTAGTLTWNSVPFYDDYFAIGISAVGATGLPVNFANVNARATNGSVTINWSNLTESDINFYEVERSTDGVRFSPIIRIQPKGNDYAKWDYSYIDPTPARTSYYRVKAVEFGTSVKNSAILKISTVNTSSSFVIYPNPVPNRVITVQSGNVAAGAYTVSIINANGQQVFTKVINFQTGAASQTIELPATVKSGIYLLKIENGNTRSITNLIIQ